MQAIDANLYTETSTVSNTFMIVESPIQNEPIALQCVAEIGQSHGRAAFPFDADGGTQLKSRRRFLVIG